VTSGHSVGQPPLIISKFVLNFVSGGSIDYLRSRSLTTASGK